MWREGVEFVIGLGVTLVTLGDVFSSILIPGPSVGPLRVATRVRDLGLPLWRLRSRTRAGGRRQRLSNTFAPLLLFLAFSSWLLLLLVGFGLMFHASATRFTPPLSSFAQSLYVAGSSLMTLGVSEVDAHGLARWLILLAALAGFGVITASVTYILQVQSSLQHREAAVLTLSGLAGKPPAGIVLLETLAALHLRSDLRAFFMEWRDWSAATLHTHVSFPILAYFHSVDSESDWLSALHAVLDAATLIMELTEEDSTGAAALMHRTGSRTVAHLCDLFELKGAPRHPRDAFEVEALVERLQRAGYRTKPTADIQTARLVKMRNDYASRLISLSDHLGAETTRLLPQGHDNATQKGG